MRRHVFPGTHTVAPYSDLMSVGDPDPREHSLLQLTAAIVSASVVADGGRGWTSFVLLIFELNLIVWAGYIGDRNAGNAIKELEVGPPDEAADTLWEI